MNKIKITSLRDRFKAAVLAFRGKPVGRLFLGIEVKRCNECHAVPVVYCKDCKWWGGIGCAIRIDDETDKPKENDFCSFGEWRSYNG